MNRRSVLIRLSLLIPFGCLGCGEGSKPPVGEPEKLTPGMEKMKEEMLKNYKSKSLGKTPKKS